MAGIGQKLETKGVIMALLSLVLIGTGCEDKIDSPAVNLSEGKTVEVTLNIGLADEADGYTLSAPSETKSSVTAFSYTLQPAMATKGTESSLKPDKLYKLEIQQYDRSGGRIGGMSNVVAEQEIGSAISLTLTANPDCQLVIVAWGKGNTSTTLGTGNLASAQTKSINASAISELNPSNQEHMNQMPYVLHLEHVCVEDNTIKSIEGKDVRLLLRRLATRLTLDWTYSYSGYQLKQILLQSIPLNYKVVAAPDKDDKTYPSLLDQYTTIQLTSTEIGTGNYSCWIPTNVRGTNSLATSQTYRIKSNAPTGSSYVDFIAANTSDPKKKLSYRVYLGGSKSTDFNLYGNTNYNYTVTISHVGLPVNDRRVTIIDPIRASESNSNLVPTANCFMVAPGGAFCFDPFAYSRSGTNANTTLKGWSDSEGGIAYVKLLWQTKENGDVGDPVMGVVNSVDDHTNIVDIKKNDNTEVSKSNALTDKDQGRIYCRVAPNTVGGNGVIVAYNTNDEIMWSWHIWVTDYNPDPTGDETVLSPSNKRKLKFTYNVQSGGQLPMMDRTLGAVAGYIDEIPATPLDKSKTNGLQYQWGRKDPFTSSYSADPITSISDTRGNKPVKGMLNRYGPDGISYIPIETVSGYQSYRNVYKYPHKKGIGSRYWCTDLSSSFWGATKTDFDPCPAGWKVPAKEAFSAFFTDAGYVGGSSSVVKGQNIRTVSSLENDGGILGYFENKQSGHQIYLRFTGYTGGTDFAFIGQWLGYWTTTSSTIFTAKLNNNLNSWAHYCISSGWYEQDAHSVRCIQEQQ